MILIVTYSPDEGLRENHPVEQLPALLNEAGRVVWVDLLSPSADEMAVLTQVFRFHPLAIEDCESRRHHPKIDDYQEFLFVLTQGVHPESSVKEFRTRQLSLFLGRNFLVTHHREKSRSVDQVLDLARRNPKVISEGPDSLFYTVLDAQVDLYLPVLDSFEKKIDEVEDRIFDSPTSAVLADVLAFKKALMRLRRISGHQREVLLRLVRREFPLIQEKVSINLRDVHDHLVRVNDLADTYRELVAGALDAHLSIVGNRTNEIMRALTVVATLFIPLTFVVGVYGMNFENMPELRWKYGYMFVWGVMVAIGGGMYFYFRRSGIFRGQGR